jgi:PhnB protein
MQVFKMNKQYKLDNLPDIIPYLTVKNMKESIDFYEKAFNFKVNGEISKDEAGNAVHVEMRRLEAVIMFGPEGAHDMTSKAPITTNIESGIRLYIYCEDVDKLYEQALRNGAKSLLAPEEAYWGDRMCVLTDINHYHWTFATKISTIYL